MVQFSEKRISELYFGDKLKSSEVISGMLYLPDKRGRLRDKLYLCLGKKLGTIECLFVILQFDTCLPTFASIRNSDYVQVLNYVSSLIQCGYSIKGTLLLSMEVCVRDMFPVGRLYAEDMDMQWLAQMKLAGRNIQIMRDVYIGDWRKREKLECATVFKEDGLYIKEELAYARRKVSILQDNDKVCCYRGIVDGKFLWQHFFVRNVEMYVTKRMSLENSSGWYLQFCNEKQYSDVVEIGSRWKFNGIEYLL